MQSAPASAIYDTAILAELVYRRQPVRTLAEINRVTRDQYLYPRRRSNHGEGSRRAAGGKLRCPLWWHG